MAAALRLVDERGLEHVTVEDISEAADVSPRTFFNYFATKDDAVFGSMLEGSERIRETVAAAAAAPLRLVGAGPGRRRAHLGAAPGRGLTTPPMDARK